MYVYANQKSMRYPGAEIAGGCEPWNTGAENQTANIYKSSKHYKLLSHVSNFRLYSLKEPKFITEKVQQ